jgi:2-C-methyl-D-erythritol 2,4-cyclodiphosphate synthase
VSSPQRAGIGFDTHRLEAGRRLVLGGVEIEESEVGLAGHSDADVLTHAVIDALLGAAGLGDIGQHFPDTDERWRDADSIELLRAVGEKQLGLQARERRRNGRLRSAKAEPLP